MHTRVWLLRHAETATPSIFHGAESDIGLSERGRRQANALAGFFAQKKPDIVISSTMRRAIDTAAPIAAACDVRHLIEPDWHERRVGILGGQPHTPEHPLWGDTIRRWIEGTTAHTSEGAESFDDLRNRLVPAWDRLTTRHAGESLVLVTHGMIVKVLLLSILTGWHVGRWKDLGPVPNLAITEITGEHGSWQAESICAVPPIVMATE